MEGKRLRSPEEVQARIDRRNERLVELEADREDLAEAIEKNKEFLFLGEKTGSERVALGIELAHQLFLYGLPKGARKNVPIRDPRKLARLAGVDREFLTPHMESWRREAMRLAREMSPMHEFAVSERARAEHKGDLDRMREEIGRIEEILELQEPGTPVYEKLLKLLIVARKEWQESSGVGSGVRVTEAALKMEAEMLVQAIQNPEAVKPKAIDGTVFDI